MDFNELRSIILDELRKRCSETTITLWFERMEIKEVSGTAVTFLFPDSRLLFVESHYLPILSSIVEQVMGVKMDVKLTSNERLAQVEKPAAVSEPEEDAPQPSAYSTRFNLNYTFDNFIVGRSNQLAYSAAAAVANHPFTLNNPLYIYGLSGLGKTHLLFAIINQLRSEHPEYRILYVTGEEFINEMTESLAQKKPVAFREKYRNLDVLLVDDIQFLAGKMSMQEEFFHTFEALFRKNKQLIIASDVSPDQINNLEDRLRTRFSMGLVADIQPPDLELRTAIFRRKALDYNFDLEYSVLTFLAEHITQNIRQIEGAIKKLRAYCLISGEPCSVGMAQRELADFLRSQKVEGDMIEKIFDCVCKRYGVTKADLLGTKRTANIAFARHFTIYLLKKKTTYSQKEIAKLFKKDHSTIINSLNSVENRIHTDPVFARDTDLLLDQLK